MYTGYKTFQLKVLLTTGTGVRTSYDYSLWMSSWTVRTVYEGLCQRQEPDDGGELANIYFDICF